MSSYGSFTSVTTAARQIEQLVKDAVATAVAQERRKRDAVESQNTALRQKIHNKWKPRCESLEKELALKEAELASLKALMAKLEAQLNANENRKTATSEHRLIYASSPKFDALNTSISPTFEPSPSSITFSNYDLLMDLGDITLSNENEPDLEFMNPFIQDTPILTPTRKLSPLHTPKSDPKTYTHLDDVSNAAPAHKSSPVHTPSSEPPKTATPSHSDTDVPDSDSDIEMSDALSSSVRSVRADSPIFISSPSPAPQKVFWYPELKLQTPPHFERPCMPQPGAQLLICDLKPKERGSRKTSATSSEL